MYTVGDHVDHQGREAIITRVVPGNPPTYQLRYWPTALLDRGGYARAEELTELPPISFEVGEKVSITGIQGEIVEQVPDGRYKVRADFGAQRREPYKYTSTWVAEGWRLALQ